MAKIITITTTGETIETPIMSSMEARELFETLKTNRSKDNYDIYILKFI